MTTLNTVKERRTPDETYPESTNPEVPTPAKFDTPRQRLLDWPLRMPAPLKCTPLNAIHRARVARMVDFGGWDVPVQYSGVIEEDNTVRKAVGVFDVSHMGEIEMLCVQEVEAAVSVTANGLC